MPGFTPAPEVVHKAQEAYDQDRFFGQHGEVDDIPEALGGHPRVDTATHALNALGPRPDELSVDNQTGPASWQGQSTSSAANRSFRAQRMPFPG